ncbi:MAG: hypothetical protein K2Y56_24280 [Methylobacterium sp.]|uniref:hypothetical protein n=1 Tax=Methylobacterium sp. TaxID=409 RepID=UPI0025CD0E22|nr:hypothetical protein [Methylobacterium sp.]MBX9934596.1 hypothetical protein [Methylobacterium sp.]
MEPMKPMEPLKPMEPMKPMKAADAWWPQELGQPSSSGGQNDLRYAFFPEKHRLVIEEGGKRRTYDSGDHQINGVSQSNDGGPRFRSQNGEVALDQLKTVD